MKISVKKFLSMAVVVSLSATMLFGCGKSENTETNKSSGNETQAVADNDSEEIKEITVAFMSMAPMDDNNTKDVVAAVNKITEDKINVRVNIKWYDPNSYATQIPMMLQANEKLDLIHYTPVPGAGFTAFQGQNQFLDIKEMLNTYAPETVKILGDLLQATTISDSVFATTCYRLLASDQYIYMRKDILDELGLAEKAEKLTSWSEYEEILKAVKENKDIAPVSNNDAQGTILTVQPCFNGSDNFAESSMYNQLGDSYQMIACDDEGKIECYYFTDEYKKMIDRVADWYKKGYVYKDAATSKDVAYTLLKHGVTFSAVGLSEIGVEKTYKAFTGYDMVCPKVTEGIIETGSCHKFGFGVPVTATEPEAAVKFLNLLYTNADLANTLAWGLEGRDWVKNDKGEATYPEGITSENVQYHTADFLYGNQFNVLPWDGAGADLREKQKEVMDSARVSKYMGFLVNATGIEMEVTACFNVTKEYKAALASGSVDVDRVYKEFCEKLKAAGIEKVVAEYQKQLDAWLAAKA